MISHITSATERKQDNVLSFLCTIKKISFEPSVIKEG